MRRVDLAGPRYLSTRGFHIAQPRQRERHHEMPRVCRLTTRDSCVQSGQLRPVWRRHYQCLGCVGFQRSIRCEVHHLTDCPRCLLFEEEACAPGRQITHEQGQTFRFQFFTSDPPHLLLKDFFRDGAFGPPPACLADDDADEGRYRIQSRESFAVHRSRFWPAASVPPIEPFLFAPSENLRCGRAPRRLQPNPRSNYAPLLSCSTHCVARWIISVKLRSQLL